MEFKLIEFVKANPVLYQRKYKSSSKFTEMKMDKWIELAKLLRRDPTFVKSKWKNLRDTYRKQYLRMSKGCEDEEVVENSNWKFYHALSFLKEEYANNKLEAPYEETDDSEVDTSQCDTEENAFNEDQAWKTEETVVDFEVENFDLNEYLKRFDVKATTSSTTNSNDNQTEHATPMTAEEAHQAKRKKIDKDAIIGEACQEMSLLLQNAKQHFMPPTPNQVFFNSIALQVEQAKLPQMDLMRLQSRVLELVTHEIVLYQERVYHMT